MESHQDRPALDRSDPWRMTESMPGVASNLLHQTLFALGNGCLGLRGAHEEAYSGPPGTSLDGTYLNGFYESAPITYPETAYGLAHTNQFMINLPNGKSIDLLVGDERFDLLQGTLEHYARWLDFRTGVLERSVIWISPRGRRVAVSSRRLVSFARRELFAICYEVTVLDASGPVSVVSTLDGAVRNLEAGDDPRVGSAVSGPVLQRLDAAQEPDFSAFLHRTRRSGLQLASALLQVVDLAGTERIAGLPSQKGERLEQRYTVDLPLGRTLRMTKFGAYVSSRDHPPGALLDRARAILSQAAAAGFETLCAEQERFLAVFWQQAGVEIAGDPALAQGIHFNQFHLLQSTGRDGTTAVAAKGVTGEGYEGHYFWDTEIYVFPFFLYTDPAVARALLDFRYRLLDAARTRARQMGHPRGALFPWRTIAGEECSAYFPAGTAQYHLNADIAYAVKLYAEVTGDDAFLFSRGAEIVLDTARIWMDLGSPIAAKDGAFCINEVTGPDEYSALVNNNYYTNAMAQMHLRFAADVADRMATTVPEQFGTLVAALDLQPDEPMHWRDAAEHMYLPYDSTLGIHPQDDSFLARKVWDFAHTPADHYPLLLHYHPLVIYRFQVCKQADVVLALLLLSDRFTHDEKQRDFDYYEAITTHDSSLSSCIFGILAAELQYYDKSYAYFIQTARMDLDNTHHNTEYGVHTAAMAGSWMGIVYGFAGMRVVAGRARFAPYLPAHWVHYRFSVRLQERVLQIHAGRDRTEYRLLAGEALEFAHRDQPVHLTAAMPVQTFPAVLG